MSFSFQFGTSNVQPMTAAPMPAAQPAQYGPASTAAAAAFQGNTLGVGYSGSGFLIMYFVGVHAMLKSLGIINSSTKFAGASGGAVAGAMGCGDVHPVSFMRTAKSLAFACGTVPITGTNCQGSLEAVVRAGLLASFPGDIHTRCSDRLYASVTKAQLNPAADVEVKVSQFSSRDAVVTTCAVSSYIPGFAGPRTVTTAPNIGLPVAYDGVATNPLPVPPAASGVTYTITVSAIANGDKPPNFSDLVAQANARNLPNDRLSDGFRPLDPVMQPQVSKVDIYPGLAGGLSIDPKTWNSYITRVPNDSMLQHLYDTGRADTAAWVAANIPSKAGEIERVKAATAYNVNAIPVHEVAASAVNLLGLISG